MTTRTIDPVAKDLPALLASLPRQTPIVMLNLLRFNEVAAYKEAGMGGSGREAYTRYAKVAARKVQEVGGALVFMGEAQAGIICPADEVWHEVLLVRYPSSEAFMSMLAMPDYQAATKHRTAALADARLIATVERTSA